MPNWRAHADLLNEKAEQAEKMLAGLVKDAMTAEERAELARIEAEKAAKEEAAAAKKAAAEEAKKRKAEEAAAKKAAAAAPKAEAGEDGAEAPAEGKVVATKKKGFELPNPFASEK